MEIVRANNLGRRFTTKAGAVDALADATLELDSGEAVAITGPSGCGKSTLLQVVGLMDSYTSGQYMLSGRDVMGMSSKQKTASRAELIGFVFQAFHLIAHKTARENIELPLRCNGVGRTARQERADELLRMVGLNMRMDAFPDEMSGGERQRVAIARSLATRPRLLLCDEPTGNLDSETAVGVEELLFGARDLGCSVLIVTHDQDLANRCDRQVSLRDGRTL